jgi:hypothetical protein
MLGSLIRDTVAGLLLGTWALGLTGQGAHPAAPKRPAFLDQAHARAVESFRQGRFSDAYGRFIALAHLGDPDAARYALWMCADGVALFDTMWDCAPQEVEDWVRTAGIAEPRLPPHLEVLPAHSAKRPL